MRISDWSSDVCSSDLLWIKKPSSQPVARAPPGCIADGRNGMATKPAEAEPETDAREEAPDGPLLDDSAAVKRLVARGKERGYVTYDDLNAALPSEQVSSEQKLGSAAWRERVCQYV